MTKQEIIKRLEEIYKEALELAELADNLNTEKHKRGDRYVNKYNGSKYILAAVESYKCSLISLDNGNRYKDPVLVKDPLSISAEEFEKIKGGTQNNFEKITE